MYTYDLKLITALVPVMARNENILLTMPQSYSMLHAVWLQIAKTRRSTSIRNASDTSASDRCLIYVSTNAFVSWDLRYIFHNTL